MTTTTTTNVNEIGVNADELNEIKVWLTETRVAQCAQSLDKWLRIGDICLRIKSAPIEGTFKDNVNEILGCQLTNDERQYSMKLYDAKDGLVKWYTETQCMKYNPRTIWTAYKAKDEVEKTPEEKKEAKEEKKEKELRKERTGTDTLKAFVDYKKVRDNAGENGNLILGDLKSLRAELEAELSRVNELIKMEEA